MAAQRMGRFGMIVGIGWVAELGTDEGLVGWNNGFLFFFYPVAASLHVFLTGKFSCRPRSPKLARRPRTD